MYRRYKIIVEMNTWEALDIVQQTIDVAADTAVEKIAKHWEFRLWIMIFQGLLSELRGQSFAKLREIEKYLRASASAAALRARPQRR